MAGVYEYSTTASSNSSINSIDIAEGCLPSTINNAIRQLMADVKGMTAVQSEASTHTIVAADLANLMRFTGTSTANLTAAATLTSNFWCVIKADGGVVTIDPDGSETIDGSSTLVLPDGRWAVVYCDGSNFFSINNTLDDDLDDIAALTPSDGGFMVGDGTDWTVEQGAVARASLGVSENIQTKTGAYTVVSTDINDLIRWTSTATASLTAAATLGADFTCVVKAETGVTLTVDPDGAETINGAATLEITEGQAAKIYCDGSNFQAVLIGAGSGGEVFEDKTTTYTAVAGDALYADTTGGAWTLTMPAGTDMDRIVVRGDNWATNNLTIAPDGSETFNGQSGNLVCSIEGVELVFLFHGTDWNVSMTQTGTTGSNALLASNNLSDVANAATSRTNLAIPGHWLGNNGTKGSTFSGDIFRVNDTELTSDVTIPASHNASATGPLTITGDLTVTGDLTII